LINEIPMNQFNVLVQCQGQSQMQGNANPAVVCTELADPPAGAKLENADTRS
jgi:hypothetical protein